jgi:hypothetical protein
MQKTLNYIIDFLILTRNFIWSVENKKKYNFCSYLLSKFSRIGQNPGVVQVLPYERDTQFTMLVKNYLCFNKKRKGVWLKK